MSEQELVNYRFESMKKGWADAEDLIAQLLKDPANIMLCGVNPIWQELAIALVRGRESQGG